MELIIIKECQSVAEAYIDKGMLEENGIHTEIQGENMSTVYGGIGAFPITLSVRKKDAAQARELLGINE